MRRTGVKKSQGMGVFSGKVVLDSKKRAWVAVSLDWSNRMQVLSNIKGIKESDGPWQLFMVRFANDIHEAVKKYEAMLQEEWEKAKKEKAEDIQARKVQEAKDKRSEELAGNILPFPEPKATDEEAA